MAAVPLEHPADPPAAGGRRRWCSRWRGRSTWPRPRRSSTPSSCWTAAPACRPPTSSRPASRPPSSRPKRPSATWPMARSATVILAAEQPQVLAPATADRSALDRAIDSAQVTYGAADIGQALALASSLGPGSAAPDGARARLRVFLFTDGAFGAIAGDRGRQPRHSADAGRHQRPEPGHHRALGAGRPARTRTGIRCSRGCATSPTSRITGTLALNVDGNLAESREVTLPPDGDDAATAEYVFSDLPDRRAGRRGAAGRRRRLPARQLGLHRAGRRAALRDPAGHQRQRLPGEGAQPAADRRRLAGGAAPLPLGGRQRLRRGGLRRLRAGRAAARQRR